MVKVGVSSCPKCGGKLEYYDTVKRILKEENGKITWKYIQRLSCENCESYHRVIPNYILPYKHYRKDIVIGFVTGYLDVNDIDYEDYPCDATINEWIRTQKIHYPL